MRFFGFYVLNLEPTILAFIAGSSKMYTPPEWLQPVAVIEHIPWWHGKVRSMLGRKVQQLTFSLKGIEHHLMVHAKDEEELRRAFRVRGAFISQNIYLTESIFKPLNLEKIYDAIYVAQLQRFKRHELAKNVERLYIACSGDLKSFCPAVSHAEFNKKYLDKTELSEIMNQSFCSLALSEEEGGMLASFESLLCGVPVVTTPSRGGRDEFFDDDNAIVVQPDAEAVAAAVNHWKSHPPNPTVIQAKALEQLKEHRRRFCEYVALLIQHHGGETVKPEQLYDRYFSHPLGINSRFIWADKFDDQSQLARVQND
jgi:glycosyltransferase involved in cell wall biosynthesis